MKAVLPSGTGTQGLYSLATDFVYRQGNGGGSAGQAEPSREGLPQEK